MKQEILYTNGTPELNKAELNKAIEQTKIDDKNNKMNQDMDSS